jgi:hypothetical protein
MNEPNPDPEFRSEIAAIKARMREKEAQFQRAMLASFIVAVIVGLSMWFNWNPVDREFGGVVAAGGIVMVLGLTLHRIMTDGEAAKCPRCGQSWEEDEAGGGWRSWKNCPGCGLRMGDSPPQT